MKKLLTKEQFEKRLNRKLTETYESELFENFVYLTNPARGNHCSEAVLVKYIANGKMGSLLRRLDSIAFEVEYNAAKRAYSSN